MTQLITDSESVVTFITNILELFGVYPLNIVLMFGMVCIGFRVFGKGARAARSAAN